MNILDSLKIALNFIFPNRCIFCNNLLDFNCTENICKSCLENLPKITGNKCTKCSNPIPKDSAFDTCVMCRNKKRYFAKNISLFKYENIIRQGIINMKFLRNGNINAVHYGRMMKDIIKEEYKNIDFDYITPVPLHFFRKMIRGYNQSEILAKEISYYLKIPYSNKIIKKISNNKKQSLSSLKEREANVKGVYAPTSLDIKNKTILVIDDVYTTGATLNEVSKVLIKNGAKNVYTATLAKTIIK